MNAKSSQGSKPITSSQSESKNASEIRVSESHRDSDTPSSASPSSSNAHSGISSSVPNSMTQAQVSESTRPARTDSNDTTLEASSLKSDETREPRQSPKKRRRRRRRSRKRSSATCQKSIDLQKGKADSTGTELSARASLPPEEELSQRFRQLGLDNQLLAGVKALGFEDPTPIQQEAIPRILANHDVVASAQTGTGKTAAFTLPMLQLLENTAGAGPYALVITPTRELARQIDDVCREVCRYTGQRVAIAMGGTKFKPQIAALARGVDVLVATPGRLLDLMEHDKVRLDRVRILVLDEADRMLDMGFWPNVRRIVRACPTKRQTLLFSATIPPSLKPAVDAMLNDPLRIEIAHIGETADTVEQALMPVSQGQKTALLEALIAKENVSRTLVFCRTKQRADQVFEALRRKGLNVGVMHADRPQKARERALERFREGKIGVLVATDVMSRGIDVSDIDAVVNYDVPLDPEDYVHRIGRTGRAGEIGHAYTFVAPDEITPMREIEYFTHTIIPVVDLDGFAYDSGRIVPNAQRSSVKPKRTVFNGARGARSRTMGPIGGRYGRHT